MSARQDPNWWNDEHSSAWERSKEALRRDWEQTKADWGAGGRELNQTFGDTLRQATGQQPTPPADRPSPSPSNDLAWADAQPAMRFGYGAGMYHVDSDWDKALEGRLRQDWETTLTDTPWVRVKQAVRRGWDSAKGPASVERR